MTDAARSLRRSVSQLERAARQARQGQTPEQVALERIAIEAAADARRALAEYTSRGELAAAAERDYRKRQMATSEVLAHCRAEGLTVTPGLEWPQWDDFLLALRNRNDAGVPEPDDVWKFRPVPCGVTVGDLHTDRLMKVAMDALCSDARYVRDTTLTRSRAAGKALELFDRIINLMQSLMRTENLGDRVSAGGGAAGAPALGT